MKLFNLMYGRAKDRMHCIMTDKLSKCENYRDARLPSVKGWHSIVPAEDGAEIWRKKSATVGGNRCEMVQRVGHGPAGYINKRGFNPHT